MSNAIAIAPPDVGAEGSGPRGVARSAAEATYSLTGKRTLAPISGHELVLSDSGLETQDWLCTSIFGKRCSDAWKRVLRRSGFRVLFVFSFLASTSLALGTATMFSDSWLRGWIPSSCISLFGLPLIVHNWLIFNVKVLRRLFKMFEVIFLCCTTVIGTLCLAFSLDNRFDDRTLFVVLMILPSCGVAIFSDAGSPKQRKEVVVYIMGGCLFACIAFIRLTTYSVSKIDTDLWIWTFSYGVSKIAASSIFTLGLFFFRASVLLLRRRNARFMLSAPLRKMPVLNEEFKGKPAFEGVASGKWKPGTKLLAPDQDGGSIVFSSKTTIGEFVFGANVSNFFWKFSKGRFGKCMYIAWIVSLVQGMLMFFGIGVNWVSASISLILSLPLNTSTIMFLNKDLFIRLCGRFEVLFLVGHVLVATFSLMSVFRWDPRSGFIFGAMYSLLLICFVDAWHPAVRRSAWYSVVVGAVGSALAMVAIMMNRSLADSAPVFSLGTLSYQVSKMSFDSCRMVTFFLAKNAVFLFRFQERYGQLRTRLVETTVPSCEAHRVQDEDVLQIYDVHPLDDDGQGLKVNIIPLHMLDSEMLYILIIRAPGRAPGLGRKIVEPR